MEQQPLPSFRLTDGRPLIFLLLFFSPLWAGQAAGFAVHNHFSFLFIEYYGEPGPGPIVTGLVLGLTTNPKPEALSV